MSNPAYELRSITRIIQTLNHGDDLRAIDARYHEIIGTLVDRVERFGGKHKGEITLKLTFNIDEGGIDVALSSTVKEPPRPTLRERFFATEDNVLTVQDPARGELFEGQDLGRAPAQI